MSKTAAVIEATDQNGAHYQLPISYGDTVRLFNRTWATFDDCKKRPIGWNGSVVQVVSFDNGGLRAKAQDGREGYIKWDDIRDEDSGRIRLTYGYALSLDARQGDTAKEHITALASGSAPIDARRGYVGMSRERDKSWLVISDGEERKEILAKRPLGDIRPVTVDTVINNVARNMTRENREVSATELVERGAQWGKTHPRGKAAASPVPQPTSRPAAPTQATSPVPPAPAAAKPAPLVAESTVRAPDPPQPTGAAQARRATRPLASRPKKERQPVPVSEAEARADFTDAIRRAGLVLKGTPKMDGRWHSASTIGNSKGRKSGSYRGFLDGLPNGQIRNHQTGESIDWKARQEQRQRTPEEVSALAARQAANRDAAQQKAAHRQGQAAQIARNVWANANPAQATHPYLARKGITPHGARQGARGQTIEVEREDGSKARIPLAGKLLVPMRNDAGDVVNVQIVSAQRKLYLQGAAKQGSHLQLGEVDPKGVLLVGEGFATGGTLRQATSLPVVVAFDSGNLAEVARGYRDRYPDLKIVIAADNDHHLPRRNPPLPNVGLEKGAVAAKTVGGLVTTPTFDPASKGTDWNDYGAERGPAALRTAIGEQLRAAGVDVELKPLDAATERGRTTQTTRDAARTETRTSTRQVPDGLRKPEQKRDRDIQPDV